MEPKDSRASDSALSGGLLGRLCITQVAAAQQSAAQSLESVDKRSLKLGKLQAPKKNQAPSFATDSRFKAKKERHPVSVAVAGVADLPALRKPLVDLKSFGCMGNEKIHVNEMTDMKIEMMVDFPNASGAAVRSVEARLKFVGSKGEQCVPKPRAFPEVPVAKGPRRYSIESFHDKGAHMGKALPRLRDAETFISCPVGSAFPSYGPAPWSSSGSKCPSRPQSEWSSLRPRSGQLRPASGRRDGLKVVLGPMQSSRAMARLATAAAELQEVGKVMIVPRALNEPEDAIEALRKKDLKEEAASARRRLKKSDLLRAGAQTNPAHAVFQLPAPMAMAPMVGIRKVALRSALLSEEQVDEFGEEANQALEQQHEKTEHWRTKRHALKGSGQPMEQQPEGLKALTFSGALKRNKALSPSPSDSEDGDSSDQSSKDEAVQRRSVKHGKLDSKARSSVSTKPRKALILAASSPEPDGSSTAKKRNTIHHLSKLAGLSRDVADHRLNADHTPKVQEVRRPAIKHSSTSDAGPLRFASVLETFRESQSGSIGCISNRLDRFPKRQVSNGDEDKQEEDEEDEEEEEEDDEEEEGDDKHGSILKNIRLSSDKEARIERIRRLTTMSWALNRGKRACWGLSQSELTRLAGVFSHYDYNRSGGLDAVEINDALEDLGLSPETRREKAELTKTLTTFKDTELDFKQFCKCVYDCRQMQQECHRRRLKTFFERADTDQSESLDAEELWEVFIEMGMSPLHETERIAFLDAVIESDFDGSGGIEWEDFETLVQHVREKLQECRRLRETRICQEIQLSMQSELYMSFRKDMVSTYDMFEQFDEGASGKITGEDLGRLLVDLGFEPNVLVFKEHISSDNTLSALFINDTRFNFVQLLQVAKRLRQLTMDPSQLHQVFNVYDKKKNNSLSLDEIQRLLSEMQMWPEGLKEEIRAMTERLEMECSAAIGFNDFQLLFHRVNEMILRTQRAKELREAESLGYSRLESHEWHEVFSVLDHDHTGLLAISVVTKVLQEIGKRATVDMLKKHDVEKCGKLDFMGFLRAMHDLAPSVGNMRRSATASMELAGLDSGLSAALLAS